MRCARPWEAPACGASIADTSGTCTTVALCGVVSYVESMSMSIMIRSILWNVLSITTVWIAVTRAAYLVDEIDPCGDLAE